jgi:hypothetical protein
MKDEYDFSNAQSGKFYKPDLRLIPPVRLDPQVLDFLVNAVVLVAVQWV